ncbi:peptidoglycan DD-metalloendopeptidase family protein [Maribellus comscasis]|uniref:Peptidoglycan DD-metalloendopeptidase family protein n=1 Tax=Maribellus comscasis TaxID=2681766 RepID=A0A6I6JXN1_9BACT|nr:M23 family metallopeptidase [Maribellus comscasis]QGY47916.1 peptidoglycan DD-metalloendopeptidase family protein [Maribellus comscasis]
MRNFFLLIILFLSYILNGQNTTYTPPVKIPMFLSGSFAELRSNHFHSGIDIKTQGVTGLPVFSVADGYISRIVVSPTGFGRALYIEHPNGTTSVYGHLKSFRNDIEDYIQKIQYAERSFRVDVSVPQNTFPLKQGDEIAQSGNSGSSGGPHLHFEIRNTETEEPLNPLKYNLPVTDNTAPKMFSLLAAPLDKLSHVNYQNKKSTFTIVFYDDKYHLKGNPTIPVYGKIGFAVQANDYFDNSWNKCGVYSVELTIDGELYFSYRLDKFSFDETRYINSFIDYKEYIDKRRRYQKAWKDPGNQLPIYNYEKNNGIVNFKDNGIHPVQMILKDTYGNTSVLEFNVKSAFKEIPVVEKPFTKIFTYNQRNEWETKNFKIDIPEGALYTDINFQYSATKADAEFFSELHIVHKNTVPLQKSATIQIKTFGIPALDESKALLVNVDTLTGKFYANGGEFKDGWVIGEIRNFGSYAVTVDTIPPAIVPLSIKSKNTLTESNRIRFKVSDQLAGVEKYEGFIDGKWALFEFDPRIDQIVHYFDPERFEMGKRHEFLLKVTDYKQNVATYEATFWK